MPALALRVLAGLLVAQQAYVRASNPLTSRFLGSPVTLSPDGNTLAVAATGEPSGAIGVEGNQFNDVFTGAGAVYLYARVKAVWSQRAYIKAPNTADRAGSPSRDRVMDRHAPRNQAKHPQVDRMSAPALRHLRARTGGEPPCALLSGSPGGSSLTWRTRRSRIA